MITPEQMQVVAEFLGREVSGNEFEQAVVWETIVALILRDTPTTQGA